ncbi:hypothetical protein HanRHA438_Chr09g0386711 [Helianthus annuus]|nr:hypothetical protein HanRHA438_Chr09g0386711 [Helianthus annuus]
MLLGNLVFVVLCRICLWVYGSCCSCSYSFFLMGLHCCVLIIGNITQINDSLQRVSIQLDGKN